MTLRTSVERTVLDRVGWLDALNLTEAEFDELVAKRVLRQQNGSKSYSLEFVGVATTLRGTVAVAPRVLGPESHSFASILRLMRRYFLRSAARAPFESAASDLHFRDDRVVREFDGFLTLLYSYREHGLYRQETRSVTAAGGRPDWRRTFAQSSVLVSDGRAIYPHPMGTRRAYNPSIIGSLQVYFIRMLSDRFGFTPPPELETDAHWTLPLEVNPATRTGASFLASRLQAERLSVFRGDRLALLDILLALLGSEAGLDGPEGLRLYGTTAFHMVWEDACRHYFSSGKFPEIAELAQPHWRLRRADGSWTSEPGGKQRPDIALRHGGVRALLDAKYYYPFPPSLPGWADIVKQIYYQESLPAEDGEVANCFLMPGKQDVRFTFVGYVQMEGTATRAFPAVEAWLLDAPQVLQAYASGDAPQPPSLGEFLKHREGVTKTSFNTPTHICR